LYDSDQEEIKEELDDLNDNGSDEEEEVYGDKVTKRAEEDGDIIGADDENMDGIQVGAKRPRDGTSPDEQKVDRRMLKRQKKALFHRYYSGSFFWKCSASTMYQLQQALNRESNDSLWLWILGMTDLIVHNRSGSHSFQEDMLECSNEVQRLNPNIYNRDDDQLD
jgi:CDC45-like protein